DADDGVRRSRRCARDRGVDARWRDHRLGAWRRDPAGPALLLDTRRLRPGARRARARDRALVSTRETFTTRFGAWATMLGVAVGLGNVWRFPYLVGRFGG